MSDKNHIYYIVKLKPNSKSYLLRYSFRFKDNWPVETQSVFDAKKFENKEEASHAADICDEKLNDDYKPRVWKLNLKLVKKEIVE